MVGIGDSAGDHISVVPCRPYLLEMGCDGSLQKGTLMFLEVNGLSVPLAYFVCCIFMIIYAY